jgi:hypothetical protein
VGAFTRNTAKENLQKTLQSITKDGEERTLYDEQLELSDIETTKREHLRNVEAKKNAFERLIVQLNAMKAEVYIYHIYIYIYMYVYIHIYIYIYIHIDVYIYVFIYIYKFFTYL